MSDEEETTIDTRGLDKLIKAMGVKAPTVRVGVLGSHAARSNSNLNNAEIGAFHEFGTVHLPQRSFLRVPISDHLEKEMESSKLFDDDVLKETMATGSLVPYMKEVATVAVAIVLDAFDTGGDGKWKPSVMRRKDVHQTLVETRQLRDSITSEVKE